MLENLSNSELLEKFDTSCSEYYGIAKELTLRMSRREISDGEYQKFKEIIERVVVAFVDFSKIDNKNTAKKIITDATSNIIDKAFDENR